MADAAMQVRYRIVSALRLHLYNLMTSRPGTNYIGFIPQLILIAYCLSLRQLQLISTNCY